jgi:site-specific recombinase XerD
MAPFIKAPTRALAPVSPTNRGLGAIPEDEIERTLGYAENEKAIASRRAYATDWRQFALWCEARTVVPLGCAPGVVAAYLSDLAHQGRKASTIGRKAAAIGYHHKIAGLEPPTGFEGVKAVMRGIRRTIGTARTQKTPATADVIAAMLDATSPTLAGARDRALISFGFASAMRRSELVALEVADLVAVEDGYRVLIRRSKGDQEGEGQEVAIPRGYRLRPVEYLQAWLAAAGITEGRVFRSVISGHVGGSMTSFAISLRIKLLVQRAGHDPATFSGHSLRSGFLTSAAESGADVFKMMEVSRHKSMDTLRGYVRRRDLFKKHAGAAFL